MNGSLANPAIGQRHLLPRPVAMAVALVALLAAASAAAATLDSGVPGLKLAWDNTVKYSTAARLKSQDPALVGATHANLDDGDSNFGKGLISNRLDLLSEFDAQYQDFMGARFSGAAWYDDVYNRHNDNPGLPFAFPNQTSTAYNQFSGKTRNLHGRKAEVLDAFVFGRFNLGETRSIVRLGRHGLVWGESLFFGSNAIAGGMAAVDVTKLASVPGTQFKEAIRPTPQLSGQIQLTPALTLGAYYQFRWEANRLPAVGSYFSAGDSAVDGAEQLLLVGPGSPFAFNAPRDADMKAKNSGQGGVQLRFNHDGTDYGLYAIRFHNKSFQQVSRIGINGAVAGPTSYYVTYHEGINAFGASASRTFGEANVALEMSLRTNQDLASSHAADLSGLLGGAANNNSSNPAYAVGKTAHINLSTIWSLNPTALFNEASLLAELAWNRVLSCSKNCASATDPNSTRDALALRMQLEPTYRQVLPGVDLTVPLGLGYAPRGSRSRALGPGAFPSENSGDMTIGLNAIYLDVWRLTLAYTHYYGAVKPFVDSSANFTYGQSQKDRDFVAMSLRRTF